MTARVETPPRRGALSSENPLPVAQLSLGDVSGDMLREIDSKSPSPPPPQPVTPPATFGRKQQRPSTANTIASETSTRGLPHADSKLQWSPQSSKFSHQQRQRMMTQTTRNSYETANMGPSTSFASSNNPQFFDPQVSPTKISPSKKSFESRTHSRAFMEDIDDSNQSGTEFDVNSRSGTSMGVPKVSVRP